MTRPRNNVPMSSLTNHELLLRRLLQPNKSEAIEQELNRRRYHRYRIAA